MLLRPPSCPLCGAEVDASDLRRLFPGNRSDPIPTRWGIHCPVCHAALRVRLALPYVLMLLGLLAVVGAVLAVSHLSMFDVRQEKNVSFVILFALWMLIVFRWLPLLAQLRVPQPEEVLTFKRSLEEQLVEDPEYQRELKEEAQEDQENAEWAQRVQARGGTAWRCAKCGEENPAEFELCWKCQAARA